MRINPLNSLTIRQHRQGPAAHKPEPNTEAPSHQEDRLETSGSLWGKAGLTGAGLAMICTSLTQPVLAAPREAPRFQPPSDAPAMLQPQPETRSPMADVQAETNLWNLAPSSIPTSQTFSTDQDVLPAFQVPPINFSFPGETSPQKPEVKVLPLAQSNSISCGQASVAMAVNAIKGSQLSDVKINYRYGFGLLTALNAESRGAGVKWKDAGNMAPSKWPAIEKALDQGLPVVVGLNGREFSPSGRGHIVTIVDVEGDRVKFADPAHGKIRETTKERINQAPSYPQGSFIFLPFRFRF